MADHEPIYQPEDPGDSAEASPDYKGLADNEYQGILFVHRILILHKIC